ncbi:alpha/beta fold hydrolase [Aquitalea sp. LB_tupeE]|uniref:alpha/beta fold hydrolase n=1 Tax=Aquitalea sp. LB_tupeE TaxID=2748078 RepID=UPI0015BD9E14|nr:alpha/beta hydrolase [Aquitalea sp. LB_tupeE]NWK77819.1 alpha/beta hydrolase [Aquitalea sp. LB_tupeE]
MQVFHTPHGALRYHDLPGDGVPLLFVHGLGCAASSDFPRVGADPALAGRRRLLLDLLGAGFSDRPDDFAYTIAAHAQTVAGLIDHLALPQLDIVGHSMGGAVAITASSLCPDKVARLVLLEPNLDAEGGVFSRALAAMSEQEFVSRGQRRMARLASREGSPLWAGSLSASHAPAVHRAAVSLVAGAEPSWRSQLLALSMPRSVVVGERSLPQPALTRLTQDGVNVHVLADAGHAMSEDNPAGLAALLAEILEQDHVA